MTDVPILLAHGKIDPRGNWIFSDDSLVVDTVTAFNSYAHEHKIPKIELVCVCRPPNEKRTKIPFPKELLLAYSTDVIDLVIGDKEFVKSDSNYVLPSNINDGKTNVVLITEGIIEGLDDLITARQIKMLG